MPGQTGDPHAAMNLPNKLTIFRIILSPIFMVFFLVDTLYTRYIALVIFMIASLTDLYDGYLARKTGVITSFGKFMDPLADKILTSTALICFASLGYIYTWMVLVIIGRDFIVTGLRCIAAYRGQLILPTQVAKWKTASQMVVIVIILLYINVQTTMVAFGQWNGEFDDIAWWVLNGMVFVSMSLTVSSGLDYVVKNRSIFTSLLR
ncbi:MAG: CDP-diacylglycerol--glycerol-3-phosphate 3-phosphatidyltransferase [Gemmatimonadetes bacterium]|nr:CDP-diacylglycerol--glycerol-3-phosphate 3-phosphatidyltransferase [Gemmatimonadota bacterium]